MDIESELITGRILGIDRRRRGDLDTGGHAMPHQRQHK
jgi:hypothetical protein